VSLLAYKIAKQSEIKKNAIYLPYDKELPIKIIEDIVSQSFKTNP